MFCFPSFQGFESPKRLSPDQFGGQELPEKSQLRARYKEERNKLRDISLGEGRAWGAEHMRNLLSYLRAELNCSSPEIDSLPVPWAAYYPIGSELNLLGHTSMTNCWLPLIASGKKLTWFRWLPEIDTWSSDSKGLPIPPDTTRNFALESQHDSPRIIVTPCLAVDRSGTRLGYGGGYYDRVLKDYQDRIFTVACVPDRLCLDVNELPRMDHDMPVDLIVTENDVTLLSPGKLQKVLKK
jgi:5-formyltetrahydrofolate cyclo-ligase